jgi:uncharacterized protein YjaZ
MRPLHQIASEIYQTWDNVHYAAKPYLSAMSSMTTIKQDYGYDSGYSIVAYFLSNAASWRGDDARRLKAELKGMMKGK